MIHSNIQEKLSEVDSVINDAVGTGSGDLSLLRMMVVVIIASLVLIAVVKKGRMFVFAVGVVSTLLLFSAYQNSVVDSVAENFTKSSGKINELNVDIIKIVSSRLNHKYDVQDMEFVVQKTPADEPQNLSLEEITSNSSSAGVWLRDFLASPSEANGKVLIEKKDNTEETLELDYNKDLDEISVYDDENKELSKL